VDVVGYVQAFNGAVAAGAWDQFVGSFSDDAVMEFHEPPVGPFIGRAAIELAYRGSPPTDTIELAGDTSAEGDVVVAPCRWSATDETGTMQLRFSGGKVTWLSVTFD
jgi:steroid Delta-isomerase